ncbi:VOC family protein [Erythrobacter sp. JK5]|uniref:VOC family protein n=1 Tax=Erythrobacter sp. JK5 TaxID=2829500 RepID=UPI001BAD213D|nr:VOC family protein [Erythrobacter sp. JK5]QUL37644.1 VOC family protein [Erythrobacter sp. JK5]
MPFPTPELAHVVYRTKRLQEMLDWYAHVFGGEIVYRNDALVFVTYGEAHHRFAFADLNVIAPEASDAEHNPVGVDHVAYDVPDLATLLASYRELKDKGIEPYWCVNHGMSASLYYADPDGNQMEFSVDCFGSAQECIDYFRSGVLNRNPVGVEFDPEEWLVELELGVKPEELFRIDDTAPVSPIRGRLERIAG